MFGRVVEGLDILAKLEQVETKREGIFVMPKNRIEIVHTHWDGGAQTQREL